MESLPTPDIHHLDAAQGWLDLQNLTDATHELEKIRPAFRVHPDVLEVRWQIYAKTGWWIAALEMAVAICELAPERFAGWIQYSESLHALGHTKQARDLLLKALEKFPNITAIFYGLSRYSCLLGQSDEAWQWLERALNHEGGEALMRRALEETDFTSLWEKLRTLQAARPLLPPVPTQCDAPTTLEQKRSFSRSFGREGRWRAC